MKLSYLDRAILYLSPRTAARRIYAKSLVSNFVRNYDAAGKGRRWKNFKSNTFDAERQVNLGHATIRNRARAMVRNNWIASRGVDAVIANTVGHGIELSIKSKKVGELWNSWARSRKIDASGTLDFFGLQQIALGATVESGDMLFKKVRDSSSKIPLKIQLLESDYIDTWRIGVAENGNQIRNGIEYDGSGMVVAYWLFNEHPGASFVGSRTGRTGRYESHRHSTDDVRLLYRPRRIGQVRGISWLSNVMLKMQDLDDYDDAQLFRQKIAACFTGFLETTDLPMNTGAVESDPISEKMEPGMIEVLPPGKKMTFATPPAVGADYTPFTKRQLMSIASGIGITYEALTNDYSNVNFSSGRMGWIEMHRNIEMWRWGMFVPMFCEVVWDWFLEAAEIAGLLDASRIKEPVWVAPRREMIDPVKETQAIKDQVRGGFVSYSESIREMGKDPDTHMEEIAQDFAKLDKLGITLDSDPRVDASSSKNNTEKSKEKDEDAGEDDE